MGPLHVRGNQDVIRLENQCCPAQQGDPQAIGTVLARRMWQKCQTLHCRLARGSGSNFARSRPSGTMNDERGAPHSCSLRNQEYDNCHLVAH
jgi:hypothetical protein